MDDEDLFRDAMRSLGVEPVDGVDAGRPRRSHEKTAPERTPAEKQPPEKQPAAPRRRRARPSAPASDDEDAVFLERMASLEVVPDKDRRRAPRRATGVRRLKTPKRPDAEPEASLDLHGQTVDEALRSLERFLLQAAVERLRTVIVVTGKGLRSERGVGVLKEAVERWIRDRGQRRVRAYSEAPRALGGRGAYILYL